MASVRGASTSHVMLAESPGNFIFLRYPLPGQPGMEKWLTGHTWDMGLWGEAPEYVVVEDLLR